VGGGGQEKIMKSYERANFFKRLHPVLWLGPDLYVTNARNRDASYCVTASRRLCHQLRSKGRTFRNIEELRHKVDMNLWDVQIYLFKKINWDSVCLLRTKSLYRASYVGGLGFDSRPGTPSILF
jgi:hypothetical protein